MKRASLIIAVLLPLFLVSPLFVWSLDFGGSIENETSYTKSVDSLFTQQDKFLFWANTDLGQFHQLNATLSAFLTTVTPNFYADVERLSVTGTYPKIENGPNLLVMEVGRFQYAEFTQKVFAQAVDGLKFDFTYPATHFQVAMGYTGLVNKYFASPIMGKEDALADADTGSIFANPKFIGSFNIDFPELFARQTLQFSILVQEDLRPLFKTVIAEGQEIFDPTHGGKINTQYLGLGLSGPITSEMYYDFYGYIGTGRELVFENDSQSSTGQAYKYEQILGFLTGGSVRYYLPQLMQSLAMVKVMFASGDSNQTAYLEGGGGGTLSAFLPVSEPASSNFAFGPKASNLVMVEIGYSLKPLSWMQGTLWESLQTGAMITPYFKPTKGPVSEPAVKATGDAGYLGTELDGTANYRPFSDLGLGLTLGVFMPNSSAFAKGGDSPWLLGKFLFSFSY
jgi:hypothetical protein